MPLLYATKVALVADQLIILNPRLSGRGPAQYAIESMDSTTHYAGCVEYPLNLFGDHAHMFVADRSTHLQVK